MPTQILARHRGNSRGYSLIELLVCLVIISILTTISIVSYQGALDQSDLKYAAPGVVGRLEGMRRDARDHGKVITVAFHTGTDQWTVTTRDNGQTTSAVQSLAGERLIKRSLRFLRYEWPDGGDSPATFTFAGLSAPQGGTVYFGTGKAETAISVRGGSVVCDLGERNPNN